MLAFAVGPAPVNMMPSQAVMAEVLTENYDFHGRRVLSLWTRLRKMGFRPFSPMSSNLTQPLEVVCKSSEEVCKFLSTGRWRDTRETDRRDHWQPTEERRLVPSVLAIRLTEEYEGSMLTEGGKAPPGMQR